MESEQNRIISAKEKPFVSVIIPSLDGYRQGNVLNLLKALKDQTISDIELIMIIGEKPCARAHNAGADKAHGEILVFFDDDIILGNNRVIENLIGPVINDDSIGISGASQLVPPDANRFQKRCAEQLGRLQFRIVGKITDSDMATHAAMAIRKDVYIQVGQENENLIYGDDPDLRARVRKAGYRIVVVPDTWVFHPPPDNWRILVKTAFQRGKGAAVDFWFHPDSVYDTPPGDVADFTSRHSFPYRVVRAFGQICRAVLGFRMILISVRILYGLGYALSLSALILRIRRNN
ncbi:MAG: glycosyltransferase [Planctomycetota bacterium]